MLAICQSKHPSLKSRELCRDGSSVGPKENGANWLLDRAMATTPREASLRLSPWSPINQRILNPTLAAASSLLNLPELAFKAPRKVGGFVAHTGRQEYDNGGLKAHVLHVRPRPESDTKRSARSKDTGYKNPFTAPPLIGSMNTRAFTPHLQRIRATIQAGRLRNPATAMASSSHL
jgi:hypothetical protein